MSIKKQLSEKLKATKANEEELKLITPSGSNMVSRFDRKEKVWTVEMDRNIQKKTSNLGEVVNYLYSQLGTDDRMIEKVLNGFIGFRCKGIMKFGLEGGEVIATKKFNLTRKCFNPLKFYGEDLNRRLRFDVSDQYKFWLETIPTAVQKKHDKKQVIFQFGNGKQVTVQCRPDEYDNHLLYEHPEDEREWLDDMNLFGPRITSIYEMYEDGTEKKIFSQSPDIRPHEKEAWKKRKGYTLPPLPPQAKPASIEFTKFYGRTRYGQETVEIGSFCDVGDHFSWNPSHKYIMMTPITHPIMDSYGDWISQSYNGMFFQKEGAPEGVGLLDTDVGVYLSDEKGEKIEEVEGGLKSINLDDYPGLREWLNYYYGQ
jgi:hypothetical protein